MDIILSDNIQFDLIQIPYNLADRKFEKYFEQLNNKSVEIHVRSVFLQGLFFIKSDELPEILKPFKVFLDKLNTISKETNRTIENIALNFGAQNEYVDKVVIGVDNKDQLRRNLDQINSRIETETLLQIKEELNKIDLPKTLLIPSNWK